MRLLDRLGLGDRSFQLVVATFEVGDVLRPQQLEHGAGFREPIHPLARGRKGDAKRRELELRPAAGKLVDCRGRLGQHRRVAVEVAGDVDPDPDPFGDLRHRSQRGPRLEDRLGGRELIPAGGGPDQRHEVVHDPQVVEAGLVGRDPHLAHALRGRPHRRVLQTDPHRMAQRSSVAGASMAATRSLRNIAARAPSTARWSQPKVMIMVGAATTLPSRATGRATIRPTVRIDAWPPLMIAVKASTPCMPRLLMVNTPPSRSAGLRRCDRARSTAPSRQAAISASDLRSASGRTGTVRPSSDATATPIEIRELLTRRPWLQLEQRWGWSLSVRPESLTRMSVTVTFSPAPARKSMRDSAITSRVR